MASPMRMIKASAAVTASAGPEVLGKANAQTMSRIVSVEAARSSGGMTANGGSSEAAASRLISLKQSQGFQPKMQKITLLSL